MQYLLTLDEKTALDAARVGRKFAVLAQAHQAGFPVPYAVCLTTEANRTYLKSGRWPDGLFTRLRHALGEQVLIAGVSVRSSCTLEDLEESSFAGLYDTYLNVRRPVALREKIEACWNSARSERLLAYIDHKKIDAGNALTGVIVQRMVQAAFAGVAFSRDPRSPKSSAVVVEAAQGLGENLVGGKISPHRARIDEAGSIHIERRSTGRRIPRAADWRAIASLVRRVEKELFHCPVDVEWVIDTTGRLWLLQARPVTGITANDFHIPPGSWTRKIADDLWSDRLTPYLGQTMLDNNHRFDLSEKAAFLGITIPRPTLAVIDGYLFVSCASLEQVLKLIPEGLRLPELKAMFPKGKKEPAPEPSFFILVSALLRCMLLPFADPAAFPLACRMVTSRRVERLKSRFKQVLAMESATVQQRLDKLAAFSQLLADQQVVNQWPYLWATSFTWLLRWLTVDVLDKGHSVFLGFISHKGNNVSTRIELTFRHLADRIFQDADLTQRFRTSPPERIGALPEGLREELESFLSGYGCRAKHRTLLVPRWREQPDEVLSMLARLVQKRTTPGDDSRTIHPAGVRPFWLRPIVSLARRFLDLREDLRFELDRTLCEMRQILLDLGAATGLNDNVFFLTHHELADAFAGDDIPEQVLDLISQRKRQFARDAAPPPFWVDGRPEADGADEDGLLRGIGTSSGSVRGVARIVTDPSRDEVRPGEILIARNTDPGWTPILSVVAGVVAEEGGLLNHCSIVARELGIPAVVGVRLATQQIENGDMVHIDGATGLVRIINAREAEATT